MRRRCGLSALLASGALVAVVCAQTGPVRTRFVTEHPWAGRGEWVPADTHVHTKFSDGSRTIHELAAEAARHGCRAIAFTDHADRTLGGASAEYMTAIRSVRQARPGLVVVAGLEWNVPPSGGDEHAAVLVPDGPGEDTILAEFKRRFDDYERGDETKPAADAALRWLASASKGLAARPVLVYNHPSRKDTSSLQNVDDVVRWRAVNDLVIGFEGGPGHQGKPPLGSYTSNESLIDRWDPVAARPGDAWDTLLQRGLDVHGAVASSDFHNPDPRDLNDRWPCQFAETWYYVPESTVAGVLRAMRAGTFFGVHGRVVRGVELTLTADGLPRPAMVGEHVQAPAATTLTASLSMRIPDADWNGAANHVDAIEFVLITPGEVTVRSREVSGTGTQTLSESVVLGTEGLVIRARGRRVIPDGPDLMFYTNAIRVSVARP